MSEIHMHKVGIKYGMLLAAVLLNFKIIDSFFLSSNISLALYLGIVFSSFLLIGIGMGIHFYREEQSTSKVLSDVQSQVKILPDEDLLNVHEKEVLQHIALGYSSHETAEKLLISVGTVKTHIHNIHMKLDIK